MAAIGKDAQAVMKHFIQALVGDTTKGGRMYDVVLVLEELRVEESINDFIAQKDEAFARVKVPNYTKRWKPDQPEPTDVREPGYAATEILTRMKWFARYVLHMEGIKELSVDDWKHHATPQNFKDFNVNVYEALDKDAILGKPSLITSSTSNIRNPSKSSLAQEFQKGVKRDKLQYEKFTKNNEFPRWNRSVRATAKSHGCENVLDPTYVPTPPEEAELFELQNAFMYSVWDYILLTDKGKEIVIDHEMDQDGQKVYSDLVDHYTKSIDAELNSDHTS
jgi:hypothetical protein